MERSDKINKIIIILCICSYAFFLIWFMFFRFSIPYFWNLMKDEIEMKVRHDIGYIPFETLVKLEQGLFYELSIILINVIVYMPLVLMLCLLFEKHKYLLSFVISFFVGVILEVVQYYSCFGVMDITDIICYTIGIILAIYIYKKFNEKISNKQINKISFIALLITIPFIILGIALIVLQMKAL